MDKRNKKKIRILNPVIVIKPETKDKLDELKIIPQEPYDAVINRLLSKVIS